MQSAPHTRRQQSLSLLILLVWFCLAFAQDSVSTLSFEDAVVREVEAQVEMAAANLTDTIRFPPDITKSFNITAGFDERILQFAKLVPSALPQFNAPKLSRVLSEVMPPSGNTTESQIERRQGRMRVLAVGDSMSHCNEGDFTWRYRLWQWFRSQGIQMEYVGPYRGTSAPPPPGPPPRLPNREDGEQQQLPNFDGGYAPEAEQAGFEGWHFSISGRSASVDRGLIENVVRDANPDMMLIMLGFNDLGWFFSDEYGLIDNMKTMIDNARRAQPNMRIVVGTVPQRTFIGGRQDLVTNTDNYNRMLKEQISGWGTPTSPITWAPIREEFDCGPQYGENCPAAHDGLHPNEVGDYQIARAFSRALISGFRMGSEPLAVRFDQFRSLPTPSGLQIRSSDLGVTATWDKIYGAYGYDVDYTINGGTYFQFSPGDVKTNRWDSRWAQDGWEYRVRIRAQAGDRKGPWSGWVSAIARPRLPGVLRPQVTALDNGFEVFLTGGTGPNSDSLNGYYVYFWDKTDNCAFLLVAAFPGNIGPVYFDDRHGIKPGHRYWIAAAGINDAGEGFPAVGRTVIAGNTGQPGFPQNFQLEAFNGGAGLHSTWGAAVNSGSYIVTRRLLSEGDTLGGDPVGESDTTCLDSYFEFPGTWNYRYTVFAYNGDEAGQYARIEGPQGADSSARCPPPPQWCPPGSGGSPPATSPIDPRDPPPASDGDGDGDGGSFRWAALGDSYAAGPGAGETSFAEIFNGCLRSSLSYPPVFDKRLTDAPSQWTDTVFSFGACTGAITTDVINNQIGRLSSTLDLVTLSIGGNDLEFSSIVKNCLFRPASVMQGDCTPALDKARESLLPRLRQNLETVLDRIFSQANPRFGVAVQLYPSFFNAETDWCDNESLGIIPGSRPRLTKDLRRRLNNLSALARSRTTSWLDEYAARTGRTVTVFDRDDTLYNGHRFCEAEDAPYFNRANTWIFTFGGHERTGVYDTEPEGDLRRRYDVNTCVNDPQYFRLGEFTWACDLARYNDSPEGRANNPEARTIRLPTLARIMHPKPAAFAQIAEMYRRSYVRSGLRLSATSDGVDEDTKGRLNATRREVDPMEDLKMAHLAI